MLHSLKGVFLNGNRQGNCKRVFCRGLFCLPQSTRLRQASSGRSKADPCQLSTLSLTSV